MPRLNPYERFTFRNLAQALGAGLDPAFAQGVYTDTLATAQARAAQQQQILLGLQQLAYQQAAAGVPEAMTSDLLDSMSAAYPFLNGSNPYSLRQQGVLDDTLSGLYPDPMQAPNPMLQAGNTPSELRYGSGAAPSPTPGGQVPIGDLARSISDFLPDFLPGSQVSELESFLPQIVGPMLDSARANVPSQPAPPQQLPDMAGTQPVQGAGGQSPLYTVPHQQEMADAAAQAALENTSALDLAAGQAQIGLDAQAQGLPLEIQRAQALAQVDLNTQLQGTLQQAQLEQQLPGMLGPQPLSEEERSSIGQLVQQRVSQSKSLAEIRQEITGLTVGMDPSRQEEAQQFAIEAWSQITGSTQAESTQITRLIALSVGGNMEVARRIAGIIVSTPGMKEQLPKILAQIKIDPQGTVGALLASRPDMQGQAAAPGYGG